MVERSAVNRLVAGSNPAWGVKNLLTIAEEIVVAESGQQISDKPPLGFNASEPSLPLHFWIIPWAEIPLTSAWAWISEIEQHQARTLPTPQSQQWCQRRAGLRWVLSQYLSSPAEDIQFEYGPQGKPHLYPASCPQAPHFSWTHSETLALAALCPVGPIGVDLERLKPRPRATAIAQRFFTPAQSRFLSTLSEPAQTLEFLRLWTGLEAKVKALGSSIFDRDSNRTGANYFLSQPYSFSIGDDFIGSWVGVKSEAWSLRVFQPIFPQSP